MGKLSVMISRMREGGKERPEGFSHVASRLTASAMVLHRGGALKPCAYGAPFGLRGLTAPPRCKVGIDAANGSPCLSLRSGATLPAATLLAKMTSCDRNFPLDSGNPIQGKMARRHRLQGRADACPRRRSRAAAEEKRPGGASCAAAWRDFGLPL